MAEILFPKIAELILSESMAKAKEKKKVEENGSEVLENEDSKTKVPEPKSEEGDKEEAKEEKSELDQLKDDLEEQKDKYIRLYSEFDNFRRRTAKERIDLIKTAGEELIAALLPVIDDFERAIKALDAKNDTAEKEGVELIYHKMVKVMEQKGVKPMEIAIGDDFNEEVHEAITQIPAPSEELKGKIVDIIESGYYLDEKVVRFAKVVTGA